MGRSSPLVKKWSIYQRILGTTCMSNQIARGQGCGNSLSENEGYIRCTENFSTLSDVFDAICRYFVI